MEVIAPSPLDAGYRMRIVDPLLQPKDCQAWGIAIDKRKAGSIQRRLKSPAGTAGVDSNCATEDKRETCDKVGSYVVEDEAARGL